MNKTKQTRGLRFQTLIPNKTTWRRPRSRHVPKKSRDSWACKACKTKLSGLFAIIPSLDFLDFTWAVSSVSFISFFASAIVISYRIRADGIHVARGFRWTLVNVWNQMNTKKRTCGQHFQTKLTLWRLRGRCTPKLKETNRHERRAKQNCQQQSR